MFDRNMKISTLRMLTTQRLEVRTFPNQLRVVEKSEIGENY